MLHTILKYHTLTSPCKYHIMNRLHPGVAKLGIALGSGPRDRGFKSRHSDHVVADFILFATTFLFKSHRSFTASLLLSQSNPLRWASIVVYETLIGKFFHNTPTTSLRISSHSRRCFFTKNRTGICLFCRSMVCYPYKYQVL